MTNKAINYQKLVPKDSEDVTRRWRGSIIISLLLIIICGFTATFSFHSLLLNFNSNCILRADIVLRHTKTNETTFYRNDWYYQSIQERLLNEFDEINRKSLLEKRKESTSLTKPWKKFQRIQQATSTPIPYDTSSGEQYQQNLELFKTVNIDEENTRWGSLTSCEYLSFVPFLEGIVAIIWLMLFIICGRGGNGYRTNALIEEPWRLVVPAVVFFTIMSFIAIINLSIIHTKLHQFCAEFQLIFANLAIPCGLLMDRFSLSHETSTDPSTNYYLTLSLAWITAFLWISTIVVMCLRCVCGPDFKIENVTITKVNDYEEIEDKSCVDKTTNVM